MGNEFIEELLEAKKNILEDTSAEDKKFENELLSMIEEIKHEISLARGVKKREFKELLNRSMDIFADFQKNKIARETSNKKELPKIEKLIKQLKKFKK